MFLQADEMDKLDEFADDFGLDLVDSILDPKSGMNGMVCVKFEVLISLFGLTCRKPNLLICFGQDPVPVENDEPVAARTRSKAKKRSKNIQQEFESFPTRKKSKESSPLVFFLCCCCEDSVFERF